MLPSLSSKWGAKLQVLIPATSEPSSVLTRRNALVELKKIDSIRISSAGKGRYAVEVFLNSSTVNSCLGLSTESMGPTVRIERELWEFKDLANELHGIVNSAHARERCDLCSAILNWYVFGENPDGVLLKFMGNERIARKLTKFMEDLLTTTIKYTSNDTQSCCSGQSFIPVAVHKFLLSHPATCDAA
ncbi:hypothetical protein PHPALM_30326 [Phytophthora palmivora]|uniref:Uncharacterized protein n=1 Tax=Phytophthora palmivora TaxID=4796 RepID=A0A2P4X5D9_9STRA|nr:hypothetical protein PHPALM_30326 [Phytophthora palmivora]